MVKNKSDKWIYKDITKEIIRCCYKVHNELGSGHKESVYSRALVNELRKTHLKTQTEVSLSVKYNGEKVGNYRADLIVNGKIIIELKAVDFMPKSCETQLLYYLKTTGYKLGLLINFGSNKVQVRRKIFTPKPKLKK